MEDTADHTITMMGIPEDVTIEENQVIASNTIHRFGQSNTHNSQGRFPQNVND